MRPSDEAASAARRQHVDGVAHHLRRAAGVEREIHALAGQPHDLGRDRLAAREQRVVGAELAREFQPMRMAIDGDVMRLAPAIRAAITALKPTLPTPNTATDCPGRTWKSLRIAPAPVWMPQPKGPSS